jgi:hypothetical protein
MCSSSSGKFFSTAGLISLCAGLGPVGAAPVVGTTTEITESVTGGFGGRLSPLRVSDQVILDETVRTNASGEGRFTLGERTNLVVFARSSIKVARFAPTNVVMTTPEGTFAVTTGNLAPGSYRVETPAGTLTPHGTIFTFSVRGGSLKLDVQQGAVNFCPRGKSKAYCVDAVPGHSVVGQAGAPAQVLGYAGPPATPPPQTRFTQYQQYPPPYPTGGGSRGCATTLSAACQSGWHDSGTGSVVSQPYGTGSGNAYGCSPSNPRGCYSVNPGAGGGTPTGGGKGMIPGYGGAKVMVPIYGGGYPVMTGFTSGHNFGGIPLRPFSGRRLGAF